MSKRPKRKPEDLGAMGESYFRLAAKDATLVVNESTDDQAGWDFEVEDSSPLEVDFGSHSKPVFRVQVKSTSGPASSVSMTFSSLLSLIRFGGPAFVLLYRFGDTLTPTEAFLVHIDQAKGTEILKALRRKQVSDPAVKANKATTTIRFDSVTKLGSVDGQSLKTALELALGGPYLGYVETKAKWLQGLELDRWRRHFKVVFEDERAIRAMADSLIGLESEFRVKSASYFAPMGIPDGEPVISEEFQSTTAKPHPASAKQVVLRLRTTQYGRTYEFNGPLYATPQHFPMQFAAMRFHGSLFDIVIRPGVQEIDFTAVDLAENSLCVPFGEFRGFVAYMREAASNPVTYVEVDPQDERMPYKLELCHQQPEVSSDFDDLHVTLEALHSKLAALNLTNALVRPAEVIESLGHLASFFRFLDETFPQPLEFEFDVGEATKAQADVAVFTAPVAMEGRTVLFFAAFFGQVEKVADRKFRGRFTRCEHVGEIVIPDGHDQVAASAERSQRIEGMLQARGLAVL